MCWVRWKQSRRERKSDVIGALGWSTWMFRMFGTRRQQQAYPTVPARRGAWQGVADHRTNTPTFDRAATWRGRPRSATRCTDRGRPPPRGPRTRGGVVHRTLGAAAEVHSQLRLDSWERETSDPWVLETVARGYRLQFQQRPPPFTRIRMTTVKDPVQADYLTEEIKSMLEKRAIARVGSHEQRTGFYSTYFLVPKKDGGLCPILDLLNAYLKSLPFKMLHTKHILGAIEPGEWFTTIDLKEAYFHVPICRDHWKFFLFAFRG